MGIISAKIIDGYAMLIGFYDGKLVLFDFSRYENEFYFEVIRDNFKEYFIENGSLWFGDYIGIDPETIYQEGVIVSEKMQKALDKIA
ncbi:MAG: DUF2442 domain-containing protein [Streptococcaceae bacterium]|jgi:poly-beta-hydroxyalkanoate depolymerase|nr:DUF2442 domain-containing protein [Streptococcaceae bacterium]